MISPIFESLFLYLILCLCFYLWYFNLRRKKNWKNVNKISFLANMFYAILLTTVLPYFSLQYFKINNLQLNICLFLMTPAIVIHHLSLFLISSSRKRSKILELIHIPLSHLMLGIPFFFAGTFGALSFFPKISTPFDSIIFWTWLSETEVLGIVAVLIGVKIVKFPIEMVLFK